MHVSDGLDMTSHIYLVMIMYSYTLLWHSCLVMNLHWAWNEEVRDSFTREQVVVYVDTTHMLLSFCQSGRTVGGEQRVGQMEVSSSGKRQHLP